MAPGRSAGGRLVRMATAVAKFAVRVDDPSSISEVLEHAIAAATSGRPGPAWLRSPSTSKPATRRGRHGTRQRAGTSVPPRLPNAPTACAVSWRRSAGAVGPSSSPEKEYASPEPGNVRDVARRLQIPVVTTIGAHGHARRRPPRLRPLRAHGPAARQLRRTERRPAPRFGTGLSVAASASTERLCARRAQDHGQHRRERIDAARTSTSTWSSRWTSRRSCERWPLLSDRMSSSADPRGCDLPRVEGALPARDPDYTPIRGHVNSYYLAHALSAGARARKTSC